MSWWPIDDGEDIIGDPGADAVDQAMTHLAATRSAKPTLANIVRALSDMLGIPVEVAGVDTSEAAPGDVAEAVGRALRDLDAAYRRGFDRPPRIREVLETFTFSFAGTASRRLSGPRPDRIAFTTTARETAIPRRPI
ncbi:MAG TPA: hypothetical protein VFB25_08165 [Gaiellaceae bacterium]|nr:hypothetical protein [Gaiellaceae bacterium]